MLLEALFTPVLRGEIAEALAGGPTVITVRPAIDGARLAVLAVDQPAMFVDARLAATEAGLRIDLARSVLRVLLERDQDFQSAIRLDTPARSRLGEAYGPHAGAVLNIATGDLTDDVSFDELVRGLPADTLLVVDHAHLLAQPWAGRALWALRGRVEESDAPRLALVTRPWHTLSLTGPEAALFGFARIIELVPPTPSDWAGALANEGRPMLPADLEWLLERAEGNVTVALAAFASGGRDVRRGWRDVVAARDQVVDLALSTAAATHPLGPRLLLSVANDEAPYAAVPAKPARIAHALRLLRDAELVYQPAPRRWRLVDPALGEAMRGRERGRRSIPDLALRAPSTPTSSRQS